MRVWPACLAILILPAVSAAGDIIHPDLQSALLAADRGVRPVGVASSQVAGQIRFPVYVVVGDIHSRDLPADFDANRLLIDDTVDRLPPGIVDRIRRRYGIVPAFSASLTAHEVRALAALPGIRHIEPWRNYELLWVESQQMMHVDVLQVAGLTGSGTVIAFIDTGIDPMHPALGGAPFGQNAKVIGGTDVGENDDDPSVDGQCDNDAHGTTVAAFAAADDIVVDEVSIKGAAPDASIVMVKITGGDESEPCAAQIQADIVAAVDWVSQNQTSLVGRADNSVTLSRLTKLTGKASERRTGRRQFKRVQRSRRAL